MFRNRLWHSGYRLKPKQFLDKNVLMCEYHQVIVAQNQHQIEYEERKFLNSLIVLFLLQFEIFKKLSLKTTNDDLDEYDKYFTTIQYWKEGKLGSRYSRHIRMY